MLLIRFSTSERFLPSKDEEYWLSFYQMLNSGKMLSQIFCGSWRQTKLVQNDNTFKSIVVPDLPHPTIKMGSFKYGSIDDPKSFSINNLFYEDFKVLFGISKQNISYLSHGVCS